MTVHYQRIPSTDPRLARHVRHDDRSRAYAFDTSGLSIVSAKHARRIPVLDQGQLGSCTGNAGIGCLGTDPFFNDVAGARPLGEPVQRPFSRRARVGTTYTLDEAGAVQLYSDATKADDYPGQYPPDDTGSDGLTIAKVLQKAGEISGYQHTFTRDDALKALGVTPVIVGIPWMNDMFNPDPDGRVHPTGGVAGGHEICADEIDAENQRVWFTNSWGSSWGVDGRFYLSFADFGTLLADQGDVTIFTPLTQPAPTPTPTPTPVPPVPPAPPAPGDPDAALAAVAHHWVAERHIGENHTMQTALKTWLQAKNL